MHYYIPHNTTDQIVAVTKGETGYTETFLTQEQADTINAYNGVTPAELKAAEACSMFDSWDNFEKLAAHLQTTTSKES